MSGSGNEKVSIVRVTQEDVTQAVAEAIALAGGLPEMAGKTVVVKPNLMQPTPSGQGIVTDSRVTGAVAELALKAGGKVTIAEGAAGGFVGATDQWDTMEAFDVSGTADVARALGVPFVDINRDTPVKVVVKNGYGVGTVPLASTIARADIVISVPVFKRHPFTGLTLACKNFQGTLPWRLKRLTHRFGLEASLSDINVAAKPVFAVVDGVVARNQVGEVPFGLIVAGRNCTAVDATCARMVGYKPDRMSLLLFNTERGFGVIDEDAIDIVGVPLSSVTTSWPWTSLDVVEQGPEIDWVIRDSMVHSGDMHGAQVGLGYVRRVHGADALRGLRVAVGIDPANGGHEQVDLVIGDRAAAWASGRGYARGRAPLGAVVAVEACRLCGLDVDPIIEFRRQVPGSDWEDIKASAAGCACPVVSQ